MKTTPLETPLPHIPDRSVRSTFGSMDDILAFKRDLNHIRHPRSYGGREKGV
jgi:hypothetical protein